MEVDFNRLVKIGGIYHLGFAGFHLFSESSSDSRAIVREPIHPKEREEHQGKVIFFAAFAAQILI